MSSKAPHICFIREPPDGFLQKERPGPFNGFNAGNFLDVIAMVVLVNLPVAEPKRIQFALESSWL